MSLTMLILICVAGAYVGWNIGANDAANCIGTSVGAGLMRYRTAILLVGLCAIAGAALQGHHVMKTVGKGIVTDPLSPMAVLAALLCSGLIVTVVTLFKVPTSTSQAIVGGVAGVGIAADLTVDASKLFTIAQCWVACPILTMALSYLILRLSRWILRRVGDHALVQRVLQGLVVLSAGYAAYALGANNVGNAIGPIANLDVLDVRILGLAGGLALAVGALTFGKGVTETVGKSITQLDLTGAFSAQISAAFGMHVFSVMGIPVSTSQSIVGGVLGVGLVHGIRTVSKRKLAEIAIGWVATPTCAALVAFCVYYVVARLFPG